MSPSKDNAQLDLPGLMDNASQVEEFVPLVPTSVDRPASPLLLALEEEFGAHNWLSVSVLLAASGTVTAASPAEAAKSTKEITAASALLAASTTEVNVLP